MRSEAQDRNHCAQPASRACQLLCAALACLACACEVQDPGSVAPQFAADVQPILQARCIRCHGEAAPKGGWSAESYLSTIACDSQGKPVTVEDDAGVPLLDVLDRADHKDTVDPSERGLLQRWVDSGAPSRDGEMHLVGWLNPRSPNFHGTQLHKDRFNKLFDLTDRGACGHCHRGAPVRDPKLKDGPDRAPACTTCHREPEGVLACGTCHGDGASRAYPPRDPCFFPNGPKAGAHAAHLTDSKLRKGHLTCTTCHPKVYPDDLISGTHADGTVEVVIDETLGGKGAKYDRTTGSCTVECHTQKGKHQNPVWAKDKNFTCNDCHSSPPANHFSGPCSKCHPGVNDTGTAMLDTTFHINGVIDLGRDGSRRCGMCHGVTDDPNDPWPASGAHPVHHGSTLSAALPCTSCHMVPMNVTDKGHFDQGPIPVITFGGLATARGAKPTFDPTTKTCRNVACHGAELAASADYAPVWRDAKPGAAVCGSCHLVPPSAPHTADTGCQATICHGSEISQWPAGPRLSTTGVARHVNGKLDFGAP